MKENNVFQIQVNAFLAAMKSSMPLSEIEGYLRTKGIVGMEVSSDDFANYFWSYLSAQVCQHWTRCCLEHSITSKETQNLFFRTVLDSYAEKKDLGSATHFSEAMYAANANVDDEPLVAILVAFFKKMGVKQSLVAGDVAEAFRWLASIWEGYCNHFDNEFDDFMAFQRVQKSTPPIKTKSKK